MIIFGNRGVPRVAPWWSPLRCYSFSRPSHGPHAGKLDRCELYLWHPLTHLHRERGTWVVYAHANGDSGW